MSNVCPSGHFSTDSDYCSECGKPMRAAPAAIATSSAPASGPGTKPLTAQPVVGGAAPGAANCPDCGTSRAAGSRYCEVCRYDFVSGQSFTGLSSVTAPAPTPAPAPAPTPTPTPTPDDPVVDAGPVAAAPDEARAPGGADPAAPAPSASAPATVAAPEVSPERLLLRIVVDESLNTEPDPATPCPTDAPARVFHLDLPENTLGRQYEGHGICPEIVVNDPGISRRHVKFVRTADGSYEVLELGSINGTKLNAAELQAGVTIRVKPGDQLTLGMWTRIHVQARQTA